MKDFSKKIKLASNAKYSGPKINKKILCIPEHCGYFYACHIKTVYPNKVEERKCLRFKAENRKPKISITNDKITAELQEPIIPKYVKEIGTSIAKIAIKT